VNANMSQEETAFEATDEMIDAALLFLQDTCGIESQKSS
jgi:hypothetical protein